jgi:hypothetical protein
MTTEERRRILEARWEAIAYRPKLDSEGEWLPVLTESHERPYDAVQEMGAHLIGEIGAGRVDDLRAIAGKMCEAVKALNRPPSRHVLSAGLRASGMHLPYAGMAQM